jgi:REP element-mobilizing transposase RayT
MKNNKTKIPWAYFLTFRSYGTWLHGDSRGSVDRYHNEFGKPLISEKLTRAQHIKNILQEDAFQLGDQHRETAMKSIMQTCEYFKWPLIAVHVRSNHVHVILRSDENLKIILQKIKAYTTRDLKRNHVEINKRHKFWSTHGSTRYIFIPEDLFPVFYYVVEEQGEKMSLFYDTKLYESFDPKLYEAYRKYYI